MLYYFKRFFRAFYYSFLGFKAALSNEWAFQIESFVTLVAIPVACYIGHGRVERALLIGSLFLVLLAELLNTAIETAVNRISQEQNELSGRAKDIGSSAVLIAIINAATIWSLMIFMP